MKPIAVARESDSNLQRSPRGRLRTVIKTWPRKLAALVVTGIIGSGIAYIFGAGFWHRVSERIGTAAPPLRVQVITDPDHFRTDLNLPEFILTRPITAVSHPPSGEMATGRYAWAHKLGAVDAGTSVVRLVITGNSPEPVIL
jgi:hypothetical protein